MIVTVHGVQLKRVARGGYDTLDGRFSLRRTEWDGPRGGRTYLWEVAEPDEWGNWVITDVVAPGYTLRALVRALQERGLLDPT